MERKATLRGQIVIPASIRRRFGITKGTLIQIDVSDDESVIILTPITRKYVHSLSGKLKGKGLLKALMAEKKREKE
jgi:AbrB family looped-hinge helix DNA binding protein